MSESVVRDGAITMDTATGRMTFRAQSIGTVVRKRYVLTVPSGIPVQELIEWLKKFPTSALLTIDFPDQDDSVEFSFMEEVKSDA